jgi:hypothetical protein
MLAAKAAARSLRENLDILAIPSGSWLSELGFLLKTGLSLRRTVPVCNLFLAATGAENRH